MAQPFRRAWDILKQGPYDHQNPDEHERPRGLYPESSAWPPFDPADYPPMGPTDWPPYEPRPDPPMGPLGEQPGERIHPQPGIDPNDPHDPRNPGPYDHTQPYPYDSSNRIESIRTQIQQLQAELERLLQMQGGGGHPWER